MGMTATNTMTFFPGLVVPLKIWLMDKDAAHLSHGNK